MKPLLLSVTALALGALPAYGEPGVPTLDPANLERIVEALGDFETVLAGDKPAFVRLDGLLNTDEGREGYFLAGSVPGLDSIAWTPSYSDARQAMVSLSFATRADADAFRAGIDARAGAPDPACTSRTQAHWIIGKDLSLSWRIWDYTAYGNDGWVAADFAIIGAAPLDGNCTETSGEANELVDEDQMVALFTRMKDDPPPFDDARAMAEWLAPYGNLDAPIRDCGESGWIEPPLELTGFAGLLVSLRPCEPTTTVNGYLHLMGGYNDMFGPAKLAAAAETVFGPNRACDDDLNQIYPVSKTMTFVINDLAYSVAAILYEATPEIFGGCAF